MKKNLTIFVITMLILFSGYYWYTQIFNAGVESSPGVEHPDTAGFRVVTHEEFDGSIEAYNFNLIDQNNNRVSLEDLRGKVVMISFVYTHCPEACPLVAANFKAVKDSYNKESYGDDLVQVLITTDPENDTPKRLARYTTALGGDWYFLTEDLDVLQNVWDEYSIYWEIKDRNKEVVVYHSYKTFLVDRNGKLRFEYVGVWFPDDIKPSIDKLLIN